MKDFIALDLAFVGDRVKFYTEINKLDSDGVLNEIKKIQDFKKSKDPVFYKWSNSGKSVTLFNIAGQAIESVKDLSGYENLRQIYSETEVSRKISILLDKMKYNLAVKLELPVFNNGNLYAETKKELSKLGVN